MDHNANGQQDVTALLRSLTAYLPNNDLPAQPQAQASWHSEEQLQQYYAAPGLSTQYTQQPVNGYSQQSNGYQSSTPIPYDPMQGHDHSKMSNSGTPGVVARRLTPAQPSVDPRTITTWPAALRFVTKRSGTDDDFVPRIRAMIANQHNNERDWWAGREMLMKQQAARVGGKKELDDVLLSVGVQASNDLTTDDDEAEMKRFDLKVHRAQTKMMQAMTEELRALGVPFFGTRNNLLPSEELDQLQKKMLGFLEDLCKD